MTCCAEHITDGNGSYLPVAATLREVKQFTAREKYFKFAFDGEHPFEYGPGQFLMLSILGAGEAPISISSAPFGDNATFELCVRRMGRVTSALHALQPGGVVGIRGPFGRGMPLGQFKGKNLIIIAGGLGIAPLRSLIRYVMNHRNDFEDVQVIYGTRSPKDLLYPDEIDAWLYRPDMAVKLTVDIADVAWRGNVGPVTTLLPYIKMDRTRTCVAVCGPPVMYKFVVAELLRLGYQDRNIFLSLERRMRCGMQKCGHCQINGRYACKDGPVFCYTEVKELPEAI